MVGTDAAAQVQTQDARFGEQLIRTAQHNVTCWFGERARCSGKDDYEHVSHLTQK